MYSSLDSTLLHSVHRRLNYYYISHLLENTTKLLQSPINKLSISSRTYTLSLVPIKFGLKLFEFIFTSNITYINFKITKSQKKKRGANFSISKICTQYIGVCIIFFLLQNKIRRSDETLQLLISISQRELASYALFNSAKTG